jgi:hypothetical protein
VKFQVTVVGELFLVRQLFLQLVVVAEMVQLILQLVVEQVVLRVVIILQDLAEGRAQHVLRLFQTEVGVVQPVLEVEVIHNLHQTAQALVEREMVEILHQIVMEHTILHHRHMGLGEGVVVVSLAEHMGLGEVGKEV